MDTESPFAEAQRKLEQNSFHEAVALYRETAMGFEPSQRQLGNLAVAEDEDRLQFRRELCRRHPNSLGCKMSMLQTLESGGHSGLAVQVASEILSTNDLTQSQELLLRLLRLKSALATPRCALILEDFAHLWQAGEEHVAALRCRKGILTSMAACRDPLHVDAFEQLSELPFLGEPVAKLFKTKAEELRLMQSVLGQDTRR